MHSASYFVTVINFNLPSVSIFHKRTSISLVQLTKTGLSSLIIGAISQPEVRIIIDAAKTWLSSFTKQDQRHDCRGNTHFVARNRANRS